MPTPVSGIWAARPAPRKQGKPFPRQAAQLSATLDELGSTMASQHSTLVEVNEQLLSLAERLETLQRTLEAVAAGSFEGDDR